MPTLSLNPAIPGWPAESADSGRRLRRLVGVSLLAHGLVLSLKFQFWPFFPPDRAPKEVPLGYSIQPISVLLAPAGLVLENTPSLPTAFRPSASGRSLPRPPERPAGPMEASPGPSEQTAPRPDSQAMIERGKADIEADSRQQMLDPMFAPAARHSAAASPLERATAGQTPTVDQLAGQRLRITTADGRRYCLQGLPEAATRDIPTPVTAVPMNCP
jgi:hypothetical protein